MARMKPLLRPLIAVLAAALALSVMPERPEAAADTVVASERVAADRATLPAHHPTTLLVKVAPGRDPAGVHRRAGFAAVNRLRPLGVDVVRVPRGALTTALRRYQSMPGVQYAEPNFVLTLGGMPDDPYARDQYALRRIRAPRAWRRYGNRWRPRGGGRIAIIDSGIDRLHPEFLGKITHCRSWLTGIGVAAASCQDAQAHGTHVAGIAAATANNGIGIAGVAFDADIMALQAFNTTGSALNADVLAAMVYAARNGAQVANYSFGGPTDSRALRDAVAFVASRGVVQVAAAGNTGKRGVDFPARLRRVIAVSATDERDRFAEFSAFGKTVEVAAPGEVILSTMPGGGLVYGSFSGTSMAVPHVSGVAALLRAKGYSPAQTRRRIRAGADDLGPAGRDARFGYGRLNANRSLR